MLLKKIREFDIPTVDTILPFTHIVSLVAFTRDLENAEGFVVAFEDGHRIKIKANQYVRIHKTMDKIRFDRNIVDLIINENMDDVIPMLPDAEVEKIRDFESRFWNAFKIKEDQLYDLRVNAQKTFHDDRKRIALELVPSLESKEDAGILFRLLDGNDLREDMLNRIQKSINTNTKWDKCAEWIGMT